MHKLLSGLAAGVLSVSGLLLTSPPADAGPTSPTVTSINTTPDKVVFNSSSAVPATMTLDMDEPVGYTLNKVEFFACTLVSGTGTCAQQPSTMYDFKSQNQLLPTRRLITLGGNVPNLNGPLLNRTLAYSVRLTYATPVGGTTVVSTGTRFLQFKGDTKVSISGPAKITPGRSVTVTGNVTCFTRGGYTAPPVDAFGTAGFADAEFQLEGTTTWKTQGSADIVPTTGALTYTALAVGASGNWRFSYFGNECDDATSTPFHVEASDAAGAPPPKPQAQANAPEASLSGKTFNSLSFSWSAPTQPGSVIKAYHWHWTSANGLPQKDFDIVYAADKAPEPVVFTGLFPKTFYTVTVSAITENGEGAVTTLSARTLKAPKHQH